MHTTSTVDPAQVGRLVDVDELVCPGCHAAVVPARPDEWGGDFVHPDGSPLCRDGRGRVAEPIEGLR